MTAIQRLLHAFSLLAAFADKDTLADYLQLASVIAGAVSDDREKFAEITAEIEAMVAAGRGPTLAERDAVRARRHELAQQIADLGKTPTP